MSRLLLLLNETHVLVRLLSVSRHQRHRTPTAATVAIVMYAHIRQRPIGTIDR